MPRIEDIVKKSPKKFEKKAYRAWNFVELAGDNESIIKEQPQTALAANVDEPVKVELLKPEIVSIDIQKHKAPIVKNIRKKEAVVTNTPKLSPVPEKTYKQTFSHEYEYESLHERLLRLDGHQKKIFFYAAERCISRNGDSGPITIATFKNLINSSSDMARLSIKRLIEKSLLIRNQGKTGRHGYSIFSLPEDVYKAAFEFVSFSDRNMITARSTDSLPASRQNITDESSSVWKSINYAALQPIGFSENQLRQLMGLTTPEIVQESLNHFAYGLENNPKFKAYTEPLNVIMGVLRQGKMWTEPGYRSPQELAQIQMLRQRTESKKREEELAKRALDLAFDDWHENLDDDAENEVLSSMSIEFKKAPKKVQLRSHFQNIIWPKIKNDYLLESDS